MILEEIKNYLNNIKKPVVTLAYSCPFVPFTKSDNKKVKSFCSIYAVLTFLFTLMISFLLEKIKQFIKYKENLLINLIILQNSEALFVDNVVENPKGVKKYTKTLFTAIAELT